MTDLSRVLDRVAKLLALATSSNVHEAALAAAAAQVLIDRHRLDAVSASEAAEPITDGAEAPLERVRRPRVWRSVLASALAEANGCIAWSAKRGAETELCILGRASDRAAVMMLWQWLGVRIEWLSATHAAGRDRAFHDAFRIGAIETVVARLRNPTATAAEEGLVPVSAELVARRDAVEVYAAKHLHLGKGRGMRLNARAYDKGRAAGAELLLPALSDARQRS